MLRAEISEQIIEKSADLAEGRAADFADYKARVGVLDGMRQSLVIAAEVFKKLTE
jgi:hypothetical protein